MLLSVGYKIGDLDGAFDCVDIALTRTWRRNVTMRFALLLLTCLGPIYGDSLVHASPSASDLMPNNPHFVIVHAEILSLSADSTSFAKPANGKIHIHRVLRGRKHSPRDATAAFGPPLEHSMMVDPQHGRYELTEEAKARQFLLPPLGSHVLLAYCCVDEDEDKIKTQNYLVNWSPENEAAIVRSLVPEESSPGRQAVLLLLIAAGTASGLLLTALRRSTLASAGCLLSTLLFYAFYERGISRLTDIRVDLLLIYPVLLVNLLALVWLGIQRMRRA
jgi:hypothetical protein